MKLKLVLQILFVSSFSSMLYALPTAKATASSVQQFTATTITLTGTGTGTLTFNVSSVSNSGGQITSLTSISATSATITYTSPQTFLGLDTFSFTVTDGSGTSSPAIVSINVLPASIRAYVTNQDSIGNSRIGIITGVETAPAQAGNVTSGPTYGTPQAFVVSPDGTRAYACYQNFNKVSVINTATNTTLGNVTDSSFLLSGPISIAISPNGSKAYICNDGNNTISILIPSSGATGTITGNVNLNGFSVVSPKGIAFTPDGNNAYFINEDGASCFVIDTTQDKVVTQITSGLYGYLQNLTISPDGKFVYLISTANGPHPAALYIISTVTNTVINTITDASFVDPSMIAVSPNGLKAYIVNSVAGTVSVLSLPSGTVTGTVTGGSFTKPQLVAFTADSSQAYLVNGGTFIASDGYISIINSSDVVISSSLTGYYNPASVAFLGAPQIANSSSATVVQNTATAVTLTGFAASPSDNLTFSIVSQPAHGTVSTPPTPVSGDPQSATVNYTSNSTFAGLDTFVFQVTDTSVNPHVVSAPATVYIQVLPPTTRAYIGGLDSIGGNGIINIVTGVETSPVNSGSISGQTPPALTSPSALVVTPNGNTTYVCYPNKISVVSNTATPSTQPNVLDPHGNLTDPIAIAVSPDGSKAYVCNYSSSTISILNTSTNTIAASNATDLSGYINHPSAIAFTPDGSRAYVTNNISGNHIVSMINVATDTVTTSINAGVDSLLDIVFSPDGKFAYVISEIGAGTGGVYIIDTNPISNTYNTCLGTITDISFAIITPYCMAITPNGLKGYIGSIGSNLVSIVDLNPAHVATFQKLIGVVQLPAGGGNAIFALPEAIAFTADGTLAYVTNFSSGGSGSIGVITVSSDILNLTLSPYIAPNTLAFLGAATANFTLSPTTPVAVAIGGSVDVLLNPTGGQTPYQGYTVITAPTHGTLSGFSTTAGTIAYIAGGSAASDTFTVKITDANGVLSTAGTVNVSIENFVLTPTTPVTVGVNQPITVSLNPTGGQTLYQGYTVITAPTYGTLSGFNTTTGTIVYTAGGSVRSDTFAVKITDANGVKSTAGTVNVSITSGGDTPVANARSANTIENVPILINLAGSDPLGTPLVSFSVVAAPTHGTLGAITQTGSFTATVLYTPNSKYIGSDSFTFKVNNGTADSSPATVTLTIFPITLIDTFVADMISKYSGM